MNRAQELGIAISDEAIAEIARLDSGQIAYLLGRCERFSVEGDGSLGSYDMTRDISGIPGSRETLEQAISLLCEWYEESVAAARKKPYDRELSLTPAGERLPTFWEFFTPGHAPVVYGSGIFTVEVKDVVTDETILKASFFGSYPETWRLEVKRDLRHFGGPDMGSWKWSREK